LASVSRQDVHYFHHLVDFYAEQDTQPIEAVKWARRDVELRSNFSTQSALAYALLKNRELPEALKWIGLALSSGAKDGSLFRTASAVFQAAGDTTQAEWYSRAAAEINPNGAELHLHY
jgi:Tfp pilus assembly protein PilF